MVPKDPSRTRRTEMNCRTVGLVFLAAIFAAINLSITTPAQTTPFTKPQVADRIRKVEDGVDQFQKYLENRGQDAKNRAETAQSNGATTRRQRSSSADTQAGGRPSQANERRSRKCHGRPESQHEPSAAQVRSHIELSRDKSANGTGHG